MAKKLTPLMLVAVIGGLVICFYTNPVTGKDKTTLPITVCVVVGICIFAVRRSLKEQKKIFESYRLTIEDNIINRYQLNTPDIAIYTNDIKEIAKHDGVALRYLAGRKEI